MTRRSIFPFMLGLIVWAGCSDDPGGPVAPVNHPPTILSCTAEPAVLAVGEISALSVEADDQDSDHLDYTWDTDGGFFPDGFVGADVTWSPPARMGTYDVRVSVFDGSVTVADTIALRVTVPGVDIAPTALYFGLDETALDFIVTNTGNGVLTWSATVERDWIDVAPAGGDLDEGADETLTVTVDRAGLAPGVHGGSIAVTTPYGDGVVAVYLTVPAPAELAVSPATLDFGTDATTRSLDVMNRGDLALDWTAASATGWIDVAPASGQTHEETDTITVTVDRAGLAPGDHQGSVTVSSNGGETDVTVTLHVAAPPMLAVSTLSLEFGYAATSRELGISNDGDGAFDWTASTTSSALDLNPTSGTLSDETDIVTVTLDRTGLPAGQHAHDIIVAGNDQSETVTAYFGVQDDTPLPTNLFFLHHSTGRNLIEDGSVRSHLSAIDGDLDFWDHDYNAIGLMNPGGSLTGATYNIPGDNTDPDGLHNLWTTSNSARSAILANHEVIAFKSCYPASDIGSSTELAQYKTWYLEIRDFLDTRPDKVFVIMSPPPRHRLATDSGDAGRARAFADWLGSSEYLDGHPNLVYFDFFNHLANSSNVLRYEFERSHGDDDSHPNTLANQTVGPHFAATLAEAAGR